MTLVMTLVIIIGNNKWLSLATVSNDSFKIVENMIYIEAYFVHKYF